MPIIYNDTDIEEYVSVNSAVHEMNAGGRADTLDIVFDDSDHLWSRWKPKIGDTIIYKNGGTSTGKMYICDLAIKNNEVAMFASNTPPKIKDIYSKSWEEVYLSQILKELTDDYQLNAVEDVWYRYKSCNIRVCSFLNQLAELEGSVMVVYNDRVIFADEHSLEMQETRFDLDCAGAKVVIKDERETCFDACLVNSGEYSGSFSISEGNRLFKPTVTIPCSSDAEAFRYAKALLRMANKGKTSIKWIGNLIPEISAGVTVNLVNEDNTSWSGKMYCYRVRHDYGNEETTINMRIPLEGY